MNLLLMVPASTAGVPDYIDLADGSGYGIELTAILSAIAGLAVLAVVIVGAVVAGRWLRERLSEDTAPPVRILPAKTRSRIRAAVKKGEFTAAGDLLARAGQTFEAADAYMRGGADERAAQLFEEMDSLPRAIECYKEIGDYERAGQIYERMGRMGAAGVEYARAEAWRRAGDAFKRAGEFLRAADYYERGECFLDAAETYDEADRPLKAAKLHARYIEQKSSDNNQIDDISKTDRQRARRAAELFCEGGEFDRAGELFLAVGFAEEAAEALRKAGEFDRAAEMLVDAGEQQLAAEFLEEAGEENEAAEMRAESALEAGRLSVAAEEYRKAGDLQKAAELFEEAGDIEEAASVQEQLGDYERAGTLYLEVPRYGHAARCAEADGRLTKAAKYYGEAGDIDGELRVLKEAGDYFRAGSLEFEHRMYEEAIETLSEIESTDANYNRAQELQGDVFRAQGRAEKAYSKYRAAMGNREAEPSTLPLLYKMGRALEDEPDLAGALESYNKVLEIDEQFEDAGLRVKAIRKRMRRGTLTGRNPSGGFSTADGEGAEAAERYEILDEIARGGMGIVYKARDTVLGRTVAFKILGSELKGNETAVKYFLREARAAAALSHPNIVTIYDAGEQHGEYYMAMEYVEGTTLKRLIKKVGELSNDKVRYILVKCCRALEYAHDKGVIHRDIKSGNVMTTRDKKLKVMDFGLAKFLKEYQNDHTQQVGTPFYMSPEQIIGEDIDFRSDLYGLGCTIFECATGSVPFAKGDLSYHHIHTDPPAPSELNPEISEELEQIILTLLEKDPEDRFQSAGKILEELGEE